MRNKKELPFRVDRNLATSLVDQVADGFRNAIRTGIYRPGDTLPTIRALAPELGVSVRVTAEAVKVLTAEGLVSPRSRLGSVVLGRREQLWRGRVIVVLPEGDYGYYNAAFIGRLRSRLSKAGYLFTQVTVPRLPGGRYDTSTLEAVLGRPTDLAVMIADCPAVERKLVRAGVRYVSVLASGGGGARNCLGRIPVDASQVTEEFVSHCLSAGVKRVMQVGKGAGELDLSGPLAATGIEVEVCNIRSRRGELRLDAIQRTTIAFFRKWSENGPLKLPDLFYFTDDYLATAAILSLEHLRVRIPEDVRVISSSNAGHAPACWNSLTRIEYNPFVDGEKVADCVLGCLAGGRFDESCAISPVYCRGDTF